MTDRVWTETHFQRGINRGSASQVGLRLCSRVLSGVLGCKRTYDACEKAETISSDTDPGVLRSV